MVPIHSSDKIIQLADNFWNLRGQFKIAFLDIGTHCSLVRLANGRFVLLDACQFDDDIKALLDHHTHNGDLLDAVIHLHPFHTLHVERAHLLYPKAKLYGTARHLARFTDLPWQAERTETAEFAQLYQADLEFSVPAGVDFISSNEHLHFSSVLAYHPSSKTIHSDDTLMYLKFPGIIGQFKKPEVTFHMTLAKTLEKRAGAVDNFKAWANNLVNTWGNAENLCAAHSAVLLGQENQGKSIQKRILQALAKTEKTLLKHQAKYG